MLELQKIIANKYNLINPTLKSGPRGFVAETYIVESEGNKYFAKVFTISKYSIFVEQTLPLLIELHSLGITHINYPLPTIDNKLSVPLNDKLLILFNFIEGEWTFEYDLEKYTTLLASVHAQTKNVKTQLHQEEFDILFLHDLERDLKTIFSQAPTDKYQDDLLQTLSPYKAEFPKEIAAAKSLSSELKSGSKSNWVITHGDPLGNVIKNKQGEVYLIDWDDVFLAPPERDTWLNLGKDTKEEFLNIYRRFFPHYEPNIEAYKFYLYRRYLDDLEGFIINILDTNGTDEKKEQNLKQLKSDCFEWTRPLIKVMD